jgi:hypothetical protein
MVRMKYDKSIGGVLSVPSYTSILRIRSTKDDFKRVE